jgi:TM2 domain-containing membrane protein YozV
VWFPSRHRLRGMMEAMSVSANTTDPTSGRSARPPELFEVLSWAPGTFAAVVVLVAQVLGRAQVSGFATLTTVSVIASGGCLLTAMRLSAHGGWRLRPTLRDVIALGAVLGAGALFLFVTLRGSLFAPMTFSVDAAHHGATVEWMRSHQIIPGGTIDTLAGQAGYPAGSYTLASLLSWVAHIAPLRAMWLLAVAIVVATWMICASLVEAVIGSSARAFVLVPVVLSLAAWRFTLGMITRDFFFAQLVGIWIALSGVAAITWWSVRHVSTGALVAVAVLTMAGCLFTYPQTAPIPLAALILELLRGRMSKRSLVGVAALITVGVVGAVAFARLLGIDRTVISGVGEGERAPITIATAGGWLAVWLLIIGTLDLVIGQRRQPGSRAIVGGLAAPALVAAGLAALRLPIFGNLPVTGYRIEKNLYTLAPFAVVIASIAIVHALTELSGVLRPPFARLGTSTVFAAGSAVVAIGSFLASTPRTLSSRPVISQDEYQAMSWARRHAEPTDIGMSFSDLGAYHLWWLKSGRPAADVNAAMGAPLRMTRWDDWPAIEPERYLVTSGWLAGEFRKVPGVTVRFSSGDAVVLERPRRGSR